MTEYFTLGSTPTDEPCAQVGTEHYNQLARIECAVWVQQLQRTAETFFGAMLDVEFRIKSFPHDFGTYKEVVVVFDPDDEVQVDQACRMENETPSEWDSEAIKQLTERNYYELLEGRTDVSY